MTDFSYSALPPTPPSSNITPICSIHQHVSILRSIHLSVLAHASLSIHIHIHHHIIHIHHHIISYHIISYHIISYHIISHHIIRIFHACRALDWIFSRDDLDQAVDEVSEKPNHIPLYTMSSVHLISLTLRNTHAMRINVVMDGRAEYSLLSFPISSYNTTPCHITSYRTLVRHVISSHAMPRCVINVMS